MLICALTFIPASATSNAAAPVSIQLNGAPLAVESYLLHNADALIALRPVAQALGATVTWDAGRYEAAVVRGDRTIVFSVGRRVARVNNRVVPLETPAILVGGRTLAPLRFLAEALGVSLIWNPATQTFALTADAPAPPLTPAPAPSPAAPASAEAATPRRGQHLVLGYAPIDYPGDRTSQRSLEQYSEYIDLVVYFGLHLDASGNLTNPTGGDSAGLEAAAKRYSRPLLAAVNNVNAYGFDRDSVHAVLASPTARARAVENIYRLVRGRYAGINLDLEALYPSDRNAYTDFVQQVADRLRPEGYLVTLAVPAKTADNRWDGWSGAYDYDALGRIADYVVIMSYDEHWAGGPAGPVASLGWVEKVARYAEAHIPPAKILLGMPTYGYDWPATGTARGLTSPGAARKAAAVGAAVRWDAAAQVPYFNYWDRGWTVHTVYFENASSLAAKVDLVLRRRLAGIALWRLGYEDPAVWEGVIYGKLKYPAAR